MKFFQIENKYIRETENVCYVVKKPKNNNFKFIFDEQRTLASRRMEMFKLIA